MKIIISYPPLESKGRVALLSQNRQFQWFNNPTYIYPMVPASAATLLKHADHEVSWLDAIATKMPKETYLQRLVQIKPDLVIFESKTPVIQQHWRIIDDLKQKLPNTKFVLVGDHVTALPEESLKKSKVDYILTGGDYDFLLLNLVKHLSNSKIKLEPGIYYRSGKKIINTGRFKLNHNPDDFPNIDRELTQWKLYAYQNGNYKKLPGTYTMFGRDCWYHRCKFCSWTTLYPQFRVKKVEKALDEIGELINKYKVKGIFDDSGCFPAGQWLEDFCNGIIKRGYNKKIEFGINMRFGELKQQDYNLLKKAGVRFILFGLESANQSTLDRLDKGIKVQDIIDGCKMAKKAGLEPHLTCMIGYPWESKQDAKKTIDLAKKLFNQGYADSLQATIVIPYPGTPLFKECKENNWLKTTNWEEYDMETPIMKTPMSNQEIVELTQSLYKVFLSPKYMIRKATKIRTLEDMKFIFRGIKSLFGHLTDFSKSKQNGV